MSRNKLGDAEARDIVRRADRGERLAAIARDYPQVSKVAVHYVITGKNLSRVTGRRPCAKRVSARAAAFGCEGGAA
jgi:hypothetical protein